MASAGEAAPAPPTRSASAVVASGAPFHPRRGALSALNEPHGRRHKADPQLREHRSLHANLRWGSGSEAGQGRFRWHRTCTRRLR